MITRDLKLPKNHSLFLFGARGTGKTTLLTHTPWLQNALMINLLEAKTENRFARDPDALIDIVAAMPEAQSHVIIDEIQKLPKLLDIVHHLIETTNKHFILTGSSAKRLKKGGANLLAGRAINFHLFPFTYMEVKQQFELKSALQYGTLPKIFSYTNDNDKQLFLEAYTNLYLKEEVWAEKYIRELEPFRHFLLVAAQANGKIVNFSNIARDVGVNDTTVREYFSILEDTLLGYFLQPFSHSFRKRLSKKPKFYYFDTGVTRALAGLSEVALNESTHGYGNAFEHFIINQCIYLSRYHHRNYQFSYLATKDDAEIELVVERPGQKILFIKIKSAEEVQSHHLTILRKLSHDFGDCESVCFSRDKYRKKIDDIVVYPWSEGIQQFFT